MKRRALLIATALVLALPAGLAAHHSFAMFDMEKNVTYKGTVTTWMWQNPHTHMTLVVKPGPGIAPETVGTWDIELQSVNIMTRQGWNRNTVKPGDTVTVVAHPLRDGAKGASIFYMLQPDGTRLYGDIARPIQTQSIGDK